MPVKKFALGGGRLHLFIDFGRNIEIFVYISRHVDDTQTLVRGIIAILTNDAGWHANTT